MNLNVVNPTKYNAFEFKPGGSYQVVSVNKSYILMRINSTFIPFQLSKSECKKVFNMTEAYYQHLYTNH